MEALRAQYGHEWPQGHFRTWTESDFEHYYPTDFREEVEIALAHTDRRAQRQAKKDLLERVLAWISEDDTRARDAFAESAREVIDLLREIDAELATR